MLRILFSLLLITFSILSHAEEKKTLTLAVGGNPNFLYSISFEDQIKNFLTVVLSSKKVEIVVEYHPWKAVPKFLQLYQYATVATIPEGVDIPSGYIASTRFNIATDTDLSLIMANSEDNREFMKTVNQLILDYQIVNKTKNRHR